MRFWLSIDSIQIDIVSAPVVKLNEVHVYILPGD
jgi:hypothetical protein